MQTVEASLAAIIASSLPLFVAGMGWVFLGQRLPPVAVAGLLGGFAGVGNRNSRAPLLLERIAFRRLIVIVDGVQ
jgi:hypothetical protein